MGAEIMPKHAGDWRNRPSKQSSKPYKGAHKSGCMVLVVALGAAAYALAEAVKMVVS
jgi:hypothetical protein